MRWIRELIISTIMIIPIIITLYMGIRHKHLYCVYKQSADIKEIAGKDFIFSLNKI